MPDSRLRLPVLCRLRWEPEDERILGREFVDGIAIGCFRMRELRGVFPLGPSEDTLEAIESIRTIPSDFLESIAPSNTSIILGRWTWHSTNFLIGTGVMSPLRDGSQVAGLEGWLNVGRDVKLDWGCWMSTPYLAKTREITTHTASTEEPSKPPVRSSRRLYRRQLSDLCWSSRKKKCCRPWGLGYVQRIRRRSDVQYHCRLRTLPVISFISNLRQQSIPVGRPPSRCSDRETVLGARVILRPARLTTFKMCMPFVVLTASWNGLDIFGNGGHRTVTQDWWVCYDGFLEIKVNKVLRTE
jgi:hypothetical protein